MNIDEALKLSYEYSQTGRLQQAEYMCKEILRNEPNNAKAFYILGIINNSKNSYPLAIQLIETSLQLSPENADAYYQLGIAHQKIGQFDEAIVCYKKTLELNTNHLEAHLRLGFMYQNRSQLDEALIYYRKALQIDPRCIEEFNRAGIIVQENMQLPEDKVLLRNSPLHDISKAEYVFATFPRSANHWVRYILEWFSQRPTMTYGMWGSVLDPPVHEGISVTKIADIKIDNPAPIAFKVHTIDSNIDKNSNLILVVRDFNESIIRHLFQAVPVIDWELLDKNLIMYTDLLYHYDAWNGRKIIVYYEDLLEDYRNEIKRLLTFCNIFNESKFGDFIADYDNHKNKSIAYYEIRQGRSYTKGLSTKYHINQVPADKKLLIQNRLISEHNDIFNKYLYRYHQ